MERKIRLSLRSLKFYALKWRSYKFGMLLKIMLWDQLAIWFSDKFNIKKYAVIEKYLVEKYDYLLACPSKKHVINVESTKTIWVFWWQGKDNMPELCRICYNSLLKHHAGKKVVLVTQYNINDYLSVPEKIQNKLKNGSLSFTNFSDIVRCMLLAIYGGLWVDATLFFTQDIPDKWFDYPFFSIKNKSEGYKFVSRNRWSTFIMGTNKESNFFYDLATLMVKYTETEKVYLEYMTIDYFMDILFKINNKYSYELEELPIQNEGLHSLRGLLNNIFDKKTYDILSTSNVCFKLSYKLRLEEDINGIPTFYKIIKNENL